MHNRDDPAFRLVYIPSCPLARDGAVMGRAAFAAEQGCRCVAFETRAFDALKGGFRFLKDPFGVKCIPVNEIANKIIAKYVS